MIRRMSLVAAVLLLISACDAVSETTVRFTALERGTPPSGDTATGKRVDDQAHSQLLQSQAPKPLQLHFLDVGQGDCILVGCPNGNFMLVDAGSTSLKGDKPRHVRDEIRAVLGENNPHVQTVVVTHPDADHYNMLPYVLEGISVDKVFTVAAPTEHAKATIGPDPVVQYESMELWLQHQTNVTRLESRDATPEGGGDEVCDCGDVRINVLAAGTTDVVAKSPKNTRSIVLKLTYDDFDAILTGDATFDTENAIMKMPCKTEAWLDCELQKIGHHGSVTTSCGEDWIKATTPEVSIITAALKNGYGHPGREVVKRLKGPAVAVPTHRIREWSADKKPFDKNIRQAVYLTATNGSVDVVTNGKIYDVTYEK